MEKIKFWISKYFSKPDITSSTQNESIDYSIDQALGFSTSIFPKIGIFNTILLSSQSIGQAAQQVQQVKDIISTNQFQKLLKQIISNSSSLIQEKAPIPSCEIFVPNDTEFKEKKITNIYKCIRENKYYLQNLKAAKLIVEHSDTIICSDDTCLLTSFHENVQRVDLGVYKKGNAPNVYVQCLEYVPKEREQNEDNFSQKKFDDVLKSIDEIKKKKYNLLENNCGHSSDQLIQSLNARYKKKIDLNEL